MSDLVRLVMRGSAPKPPDLQTSICAVALRLRCSSACIRASQTLEGLARFSKVYRRLIKVHRRFIEGLMHPACMRRGQVKRRILVVVVTLKVARRASTTAAAS
eukprot:2819888-Pyramimonas_sp.AAC.1